MITLVWFAVSVLGFIEKFGPKENAVELRHSMSQGTVVGQVQDDDFVLFQNIPYAKPPLDELRFMPPVAEPPRFKDGELKDFHFRQCLQDKGMADALPVVVNTTEDCLVLNVWAPKDAVLKKKSKLPVAFWIHGGGFVQGAGWFYNPKEYLRKDMIIVTITYRLGIMGYLAHEGIEKRTGQTTGGYNGHLDQIAAMKWVKQKIAEFGGDPDNVTILGESAGGWSVCTHLVSPKSKGLFHKAVIESGSCVGAITNITLTEGLETNKIVLAKAFPGEFLTVHKLQNKTTDVLMRASNIWPSVDGFFLRDTPEKLFKEKKFNIPAKNIILGVNTYESGVLPMFPVHNPHEIDDVDKKFLLKHLFSDKNLKTVLENTKSLPGKKAIEVIGGHFQFDCPSLNLMEDLGPDARYYSYGFHPDDKATPLKGSKQKGFAKHGAELTSFFDHLDMIWPEDKTVGQDMADFWRTFIIGGPDALAKKGWKSFGSRKEYMYFGQTTGGEMMTRPDEWDLCGAINDELKKDHFKLREYVLYPFFKALGYESSPLHDAMLAFARQALKVKKGLKEEMKDLKKRGVDFSARAPLFGAREASQKREL